MPSFCVAALVKDEASNYLPSALEAWSDFADKIVILNDNSSDSTGDLCRSAGAFVVDWEGPKAWGSETRPRQKLWEMAVGSGTDWIFVLDADMVPTKDPKDLLFGGVDGILFHLYDLWRDDFYRSDNYWKGHLVPRLWLVRNPRTTKGQNWGDRNIHSGHFPLNLRLERIVTAPRDYSLLNYAYLSPSDRVKKKQQYMTQGHHLTTHEWLHACSIDDPDPTLLPMDVDARWPLSKSSSVPQSEPNPESLSIT